MAFPYPSKNNQYIHTDMNLAVSMTAESNALAVATTANWLSVATWRASRLPSGVRVAPTERAVYHAIEAFDLGIWCDASTTLTSPLLYGIRQCPQTLADDGVDGVDTTDNELDITSHSYLTGDGPLRVVSDTTQPGGVSATTNYWVRVRSANAVSLFTSLADAVADTNEVDITSAGSGTITVSDVQGSANPDDDTQRLHFFLYGSINGGSTITLAAQTAYVERILHSPLTLYYAINASTSATETVTARATPVQRVEW